MDNENKQLWIKILNRMFIIGLVLIALLILIIIAIYIFKIGNPIIPLYQLLIIIGGLILVFIWLILRRKKFNDQIKKGN